MSRNDATDQTLAERAERLKAARAFVERWSVAGAALQEARCRELQDLDDETARRMTLDLLQLWRPVQFDDLSAGLVAQQRLFEKLRRRKDEEPISK